jgi:hypothetical protein
MSIIIIVMFMKDYACFPFLDPQNEIGPSFSSSVVLPFEDFMSVLMAPV